MMIVELDSATLRPASSVKVDSKIAQILPRRFEQLLSVEFAMIISPGVACRYTVICWPA